MSLDVSLYDVNYLECDCGKRHEILGECVYDANITHNLNTMADRAGIYKHLWRPEEINITKAKELIKPIQKGLDDMKKRPEYYKRFDSPNKWGTYKDFIPWIEDYLEACIKYPNSDIHISR